MARGRAGLLLDRPGREHALGLAAGEAGREGLVGGGLAGVGAGLAAGFGGLLAVSDLEDLPAGLLHGGAAALVVIDDRRGGDRGDHGGRGVDVIGVPGREEAAADQIVDLGLVAGEAAGGGGGREDRVVVADAAVVDEAGAERGHAGAGGEQAGVAAGDRGDDGGQGLGDGAREVAAVGARVADELVLLVEGLGEVEGALGAEAVQAIGVALQLGEVVEEGRGQLAGLGLDRGDDGLAGAGAGDDRGGLAAVGGQAAALAGILGPGLAGDGRAKPCALIGERRGLGGGDRLEAGDHLAIVLGHEVADRQLALDEDRQGRGLHAADRDVLIEDEAVGAREVHADQPVGAAAAAGGVGEAVVVGAAAQLGEAVGDRLAGERRDPQAADRLGAAGGLVDVAEDELALAAGVGGADDPGDGAVAQDPAHDGELLGGAGHDDQRELVGEHRQGGEAPALPGRVDLVRLGERDEVADRPADDVAVAGVTAVAAPRGAEGGGDVPGDGGLLGDDGGGHEGGVTRAGLRGRGGHEGGGARPAGAGP